ncbi:MAG: HPr kinase/phosphatase C-terminal domain-containing protein [Zymomonas mobilis subsp. pomaceae]|uniref:HPr kinase/phosphorylase n=1 Tax=Zymomonas mobilis TaxID=542 RepID=UPI0039E90D7F
MSRSFIPSDDFFSFTAEDEETLFSYKKPLVIHATTVAIKNLAVLLIGRSGSGKSDLALRLLDRGASLVSDDYTLIEPIYTSDTKSLLAKAPPSIAHLLEVRGLGIITIPYITTAKIALLAILDQQPKRMPEKDSHSVIGDIRIPQIRLNAFENSAPLKIEIKIDCLLGDILLEN